MTVTLLVGVSIICPVDEYVKFITVLGASWHTGRGLWQHDADISLC